MLFKLDFHISMSDNINAGEIWWLLATSRKGDPDLQQMWVDGDPEIYLSDHEMSYRSGNLKWLYFYYFL